MDTKEAGRLGGLKGGRSKSPAKLAGLARARAVSEMHDPRGESSMAHVRFTIR